MLKSAVGRVVPDATIETVNDADALAPHLASDRVLLVNRVLDGRFDSTSGIELIEQTASGADAPLAILISDREDAQSQAVTAGARVGFGKRDLYAPETASILREAVETGP
jgi:hypothetical protein